MISVNYATEDDQARILELAELAFGSNYLKPEHFKHPFYYTFMVAVEEGETLAFACCSITRGVGSVDDVVVAEDAKRRGIGTTLVSHCLAHLWQMGALTVESNAWEYIDTRQVPLRTALEKNEFEEVEYQPKFYFHPENKDQTCVLCGYPCYCSAFLFRRTLDHEPPKIL